MSPNHISNIASGAWVTPAHECVTLTAPRLPEMPPEEHTTPGPAPAPAPCSVEYNLEVPSNKFEPKPPLSTESSHGEGTNILHDTCLLPPPLCKGHSSLHDGDALGSLVRARPVMESSSLQSKQYDQHGVDEPAGRGTLSHVPGAVHIHCATTCAQTSNSLNYHVNPDNNVYRWQTTDGPIPVGVNLSSFESRQQRLLVKRCLTTVLRSWNDNSAGPKFQFVNDPGKSAFFVTYGGDHPQCYASSFFPGWLPKDWYIYVYKMSFTISEGQGQCLVSSTARNIQAARTQTVEQNLIKILAHEMLHVIGVRHCDVELNREREPYVRFPPGLSDNDNWDPLMQPELDRMDMHELGWKSQTISEIRQIYSMKEGEVIGYHVIRDVSWRDGAENRKWLARMNSQYSVSKPRKKE